MFEISKRECFRTIGELKEILKNFPDSTEILTYGDDFCYIHQNKKTNEVYFDNEDLEDYYFNEMVDYDINKRQKFKSVKELNKLLEEFTDEIKIYTWGDEYCWILVNKNCDGIQIDNENYDI